MLPFSFRMCSLIEVMILDLLFFMTIRFQVIYLHWKIRRNSLQSFWSFIFDKNSVWCRLTTLAWISFKVSWQPSSTITAASVVLSLLSLSFLIRKINEWQRSTAILTWAAQKEEEHESVTLICISSLTPWNGLCRSWIRRNEARKRLGNKGKKRTR